MEDEIKINIGILNILCYNPNGHHFGEVSEWLMVTHSKCVLGKLNGGSNPPLSVTAVFPPFAVDFRVLDLGLFLQ
jgi:hypothetical protein